MSSDVPAVAVTAPPPLPAFSPSIEWLKTRSLVAQSGITLNLDIIDIIQAKENEITQKLSKSIPLIHYSSGLFSAWVVESGLVGLSFGHPKHVQDPDSLPIKPPFVRGLEISLPWKTELILLAYVEQNPSVSGEGLLRFSLGHGMPVFVSWSRQLGKQWADAYSKDHPPCNEFHEVLSPSPLDPKLTPAQMCARWRDRVEYIFHRRDGIRLAFYGGYLSRLALQIIGPRYLSEVLKGPSHMYLVHKKRFAVDTEGEWDSRDTEMHARPEDDMVLQDVAGLTTTNGLSLWPPLNVFLKSDQWTGIWSNHNEEWFLKMWKMVNEGSLIPQPWSERRGGDRIGVGLRGQWPSQRKAAAVRRAGEDLLQRLRSHSMDEFNATPVSTSGTLKL